LDGSAIVGNRPCPSFLIFQDQTGYWRWNFADAAGRIVAASTIAFARPTGCVQTIKQIRGAAPLPVIVSKFEGTLVPAAQPGPSEVENEAAGNGKSKVLNLKRDQILQ
jgi:uncharacterized protein YegP (UPF0339 family)